MARKGIKLTEEQVKALSEALWRYYLTHNVHWKGKKLPKEMLENQVKGRLKYYAVHGANNKGIPHRPETIEKIRQSCLRSKVGIKAEARSRKQGEII